MSGARAALRRAGAARWCRSPAASRCCDATAAAAAADSAAAFAAAGTCCRAGARRAGLSGRGTLLKGASWRLRRDVALCVHKRCLCAAPRLRVASTVRRIHATLRVWWRACGRARCGAYLLYGRGRVINSKLRVADADQMLPVEVAICRCSSSGGLGGPAVGGFPSDGERSNTIFSFSWAQRLQSVDSHHMWHARGAGNTREREQSSSRAANGAQPKRSARKRKRKENE